MTLPSDIRVPGENHLRAAKILGSLLAILLPSGASPAFAQTDDKPIVLSDGVPPLIPPPKAAEDAKGKKGGGTVPVEYPPTTPYDPARVYLPEPDSIPSPQKPIRPFGPVWLKASYEFAFTDRGRLPTLLDSTDMKDGHSVSGYRVETGIWLDELRTFGFATSFLYLEPRQGIVRAAEPGASGFLEANQRFLTADSDLLVCLDRGDDFAFHTLFGYRYARLSEAVRGGYVISDRDFAIQQGSEQAFVNNFHGLNLGLTGEYRRGRWELSAGAKVALGGVFSERVDTSLLSVNGVRIDSQSGRFRDTDAKFAFLPEVTANLGYRVTERWRLDVGYQYLYLSDSARPDLNSSSTLSQSFYLHALRLGAEFRF